MAMQDDEVIGYGETGRDATSLNQAVRASSESFSQDIDGICTATYVCTGNYYKLINTCAKQKKHPDFDWLVKTNFGVQRLDGTLGRGTMTFKGVPQNKSYYRYAINSDVNAEPIETHPFFKKGNDIPDDAETITAADAYGYRFGDQIEGTEPKGSKQAYYDQADMSPAFKHFPANAKFNLPGVQQYLQLSMTFDLVYVTHIDDNFTHQISGIGAKEGGYIFRVGHMTDPPSEIKPDIDSVFRSHGGVANDYSWLVTKVNTEIVGTALRQDVQFTLSGYKGWNRLLYNALKEGQVEDDRFQKLT